MAFVPPLFSKLGKSASDLFTKKYDFKHNVSTKTKTKNGIAFTSGFDVGNKGLGGLLKLKCKRDTFGEVEGELRTGGVVKGTVKAKKLVKNAVFIAGFDGKPKEHPKEPLEKVGVEYTQEGFAGAAQFETSFWKHSLLHASAVVGMDGMSVGGEVKVDPNNSKKPQDYAVAAQYDKHDYTVTVKTSDKFEGVSLQGFMKASADHQVGVQLNKKLDGSGDDSIAVGTEYRVDPITRLKAKGDTKGILSLAFEHRLKNPQVLLTAASSLDAANLKTGNFAAKDFGISLLLGDYEEDD
jgi:hypothetical protein